ncbi:hypothetical protein PENTCL1PPCAC_25533, partial [Pristionchus entomophagus]
SSLSSPVIHPKRARPSQDEEMMDYYPNSADPPRCAARRTVESTSLPSSPTHYGYTNQLQFFGHNDAKPEMGHSAEALLPMNYLFSMIKSDQPTVCVMCYKKADVMHYGVAACATCKTFFRRSLLSDRELHCKRKEECFEQPEYWNVVKNAQRPGQCTWCRLNRFVTRGMNPCAISPGPGKDLFEYPNIVKIFDTRKRDSALIFDLVEEYKRVRITVLDDSLEDIFWSVRRSDKKHRQLRASEFNPSPKTRFNWDLKDYFGQPREMDDDIRGDNDDEEESVVRSDRRRTLPLFALQKNWHYVDTICSIEYVKYFVATMKLELDQTDQMTILRKTVVQIKLLEMYHFSWLAGFDQLTFPDGTHKSKILWNTNPRADTLLEMITSLSLSRAELSIIKAIVICNTDQISPAGRELLETLKVKLSKILISFCIQKFDHSIGIVRVTAIMDLFYALEAQKSDEIQQHVIAYLTKKEPAIMRDLYFRSD